MTAEGRPDRRTVMERAIDSTATVLAFVAPAGHGKTTALDAVEAAATAPMVRVEGGRGAAAIEELRTAVGPDVLALVDDVDRFDADQVEALAATVEQVIAADGRVVLASRTWPDLPLRRWQVAGRAEIVTATDLLLGRGELGLLLDLAPDEADRVADVTGGWPSAVALLAQHLRHHPLDTALAKAHEDHVRFVADEVLGALTPDERALLVRLTVLDRLDPPVVAAVAEDPAAPGRLATLADRTQLLDVRAPVVGWNADVREALLRELHRTDPAAVPRHHHAAADALAGDRRQVAARLHHLVQARAWDEGKALVITSWADLLDADHFDVLVAAALAMPSDHFQDDVFGSLGAGAVLLVWGEPTAAAAYLDADCVRADIEAAATAAALRAHATWWATAPDQAIECVAQANDLLDSRPGAALVPLPGFEPMTTGRSMLAVSEARAMALAGRVAEAAERLGVVAELPLDDPVAGSVSAWATKAWVDALAGDLVAARTATDMAFTLAHAGGWEGTPSLAPAHLARALVGARSGIDGGPRWDDVDEAAEIAVRARAWGLLRVARSVAAICGDVDHPLPAAEASSPALAPLAERLIGTWQARAALRRGDPTGAAALLALVPPTEEALAPWVEVALAVHGPEAAAEALASWRPASTPAGQLGLLLGEAALAEPGTARNELARTAFERARATGLVGMVLEAPPPAWEALLIVAPDDPTVRALAEQAGQPPPRARPDLSERELEILRLLDGPLSLNDVGREVYLSGHTAKWYAARIYRKLGAHSRVEAVDRARALGLL